MKGLYVGLIVAMVAVLALAAKKEALDPDVGKLLKAAGASSYAHKPDYGAGIRDVYLGYDQDGAIVVGVAARETRSYRKAVALVSVVPANSGFKIEAAEIPKIGIFWGKSNSLTRDALKDIEGRKFADARQTREIVDAVTGATKYLHAIYVSYSHMTAKVIEEMQAKPDWQRKPLDAP